MLRKNDAHLGLGGGALAGGVVWGRPGFDMKYPDTANYVVNGHRILLHTNQLIISRLYPTGTSAFPQHQNAKLGRSVQIWSHLRQIIQIWT